MKQCIPWLLVAAFAVTAVILLVPRAEVDVADAPVMAVSMASNRLTTNILNQSMGHIRQNAGPLDFLSIILMNKMHYTLSASEAPLWAFTKSGHVANVARVTIYDELMEQTSTAYPMHSSSVLDTKYFGFPLITLDDVGLGDVDLGDEDLSTAEIKMLRFVLQHSPSYLQQSEVQAWLTQTGFTGTATEPEMRIAVHLALYCVAAKMTPADWALDAPGNPVLSAAYPNVSALLAHYYAQMQTSASVDDSISLELDAPNAMWRTPELFGPLTLSVQNATSAYETENFSIEMHDYNDAFAAAPTVTDANGAVISHITLGQPFYIMAPGAADWVEEVGLFELRVVSQNPLPYRDVLILFTEQLFIDPENPQTMLSARNFTGILRFSILDLLYKEMEK